MSEAIITVEHVSKSFGTVAAVDDLSFDVDRGAIAALLGGNGAGKTTTISMLLGLLLPSAGSIRIFGHDMVRCRYRALPRMNFASPYVDLPQRLTVRENLTIYAQLYGVDRIGERLAALAADLEITDLISRPYGKLSAGQRTRVALAKALINEPDLLLLDEPTASLDPDSADYMRTYIERYQARTGATILMASHNMYEVERMCSDVIMLRKGRLIDRGTPRALIDRYGRKNMEEVFLEIARHGRNRGLPDREAAADG
jgi:ABC-2 type transport system ATP-binding protein